MNRTFLEWTGFQRDELVGKRRFQDLLTPGGRIFHETHWSPLLHMQGSVREIAVEIVCAGGARLPVLVNAALRRSREGAPELARVTVFNATDRKEYERELLRARQRAERSEARSKLLQQVAAEFAAAATTAAIADAAVSAVTAAFGADGAIMWLLDEDDQVLESVAATASPAASYLHRIALEAPVPQAEAVHTREIVTVESLDVARARYPSLVDAMADALRQAVVVVPLLSADGSPRGVLGLGFGSPRGFDADELALLRTLGRQTGQALERAALYEAEQRHRAQADVLQRITGVLAAALSPYQIADAVVGALVGAGVAQRAAFGLVDPESGRPGWVAVSGLTPAVLDRPAGPADVALRTGAPLFHETALPRDGDAEGSAAGEAVAALPLVAGGNAAGVLCLGYDGARRFPAAERAFLRALAGQSAQALERARLQEETVRREARAALLAEAGRAMEEGHAFADRARRLVDVLVPRLAEGARVEVPAPGGTECVAIAPRPPVGTQAPPALPGEVRAAIATAAATSRVETIATGPDAPAYVVLPVRSGDQRFGALVLTRAHDRPRFTRADVEFLVDVADRAALSFANARLYEQERDVAHTLQRSLLAGEPPGDRRFAVAARYRPGIESLEVGGDWYDAFLVGDDRLAVVVGDVVGRGIEAASAMGQLRSAIRALAIAQPGPARLVELLDRYVEQSAATRNATVVYAEIDLAGGRMRYACAGHPPPVVVGAGGVTEVLWGGRSAPLGAHPEPVPRDEAEWVLAPGARLLLYTDGVIERRDRDIDEGLDRLVAEVATRWAEPLATCLDGLTATMLADEDYRDDVCLLCLELRSPAGFERRVRADPGQLAPLRADLRDWLAGQGLDRDECEVLVVACAEALSNAVEHGYREAGVGEVHVSAHLAAAPVEPVVVVVEVVVTDGGEWRHEPATGDRGRGLAIMRALTDEVQVSPAGPAGTVVTLRKRVTRRTAG